MRKVYACLAATCHAHFGQNDRDLLRATVLLVSGHDGISDIKIFWSVDVIPSVEE